MFTKNKLNYAISVALASSMSVPLIAQEDGESKKKFEKIVITATKSESTVQDTPIAVQALDEAALKDQNIGNFDDFVRYVPNVTSGGRGPGQSDIFIRGMAIQPITVMLSGAQGTMPNVALYVDEQPVTAPGRNLDVYATDLERIEVLPGPQGTLFGASSQAGTIRYITNKPDFYDFSAGFNSSVSFTAGGEMSNSVEGFINLPITDEFAMRAAMYSVNRGGYIDNVYGEFTLDGSPNPTLRSLPADTTYETTNNAALVEEDFNDSSYNGFRLSGTYKFSDDWQLMVQHAQQVLEADGVFDYDPEVGDLEVQRFFKDGLEDEFSLTSWTVDGRLDDLKVVYTGAYLDRNVEQSIDYTGYNNTGAFIAYYTCSYTGTGEFLTDVRECKDPTKGFIGLQDHTRLTQEFRVSGEINDGIRFITGVFYDDVEIKTQDNYIYVATPELGFAPNAPISTAVQVNPNTRLPGVAFFNDVLRTEKQLAIFGEMYFDLTEQLSLALGMRYYDIESDFAGSSNFANGVFSGSVDGDSGRDYDISGGHSKEPLTVDDVIPKVNLSYKLSDDVLLYGTYSEGFRPGGFNRGGGIPSANPAFPDVQITYSTDDVVNYEFGWKSMLLDNSLRLNGNFYFIEWSDMQVSRFDPVNVSILTFIENAADSEIFGFEADFAWHATDNFQLMGALSFNDTELTAVNAEVIEISPVGSSLPLTPELQGNIRARYDWNIGGYFANWQLGLQFAGKSYSSIVASSRMEQDSYSVANFSFGIEKDNWGVKLYADNLTDERPDLFINDQDDIPRITTLRPRTLGMAISYKY